MGSVFSEIASKEIVGFHAQIIDNLVGREIEKSESVWL
jgi:hypothetical protein